MNGIIFGGSLFHGHFNSVSFEAAAAYILVCVCICACVCAHVMCVSVNFLSAQKLPESVDLRSFWDFSW